MLLRSVKSTSFLCDLNMTVDASSMSDASNTDKPMVTCTSNAVMVDQCAFLAC
jgi:hypothetical protein